MKVRLPDGTVIDNVPDNISKSDLVKTLKNNGMSVPNEWLSSDQSQNSDAIESKAAQMASEGMNTLDKFLVGAGKSMSEPIDALTQLWGHISGKSKEELLSMEKKRKEDERLYEKGPGKDTSGKVGEFAGEASKMAPSLLMGSGMPSLMAQGAVQESLRPVDEGESFVENKAKQAGLGAAIGAGAKVGGDAIAKGIGKVSSPFSHLASETSEISAKKAMSMGYNIMAGQTLKEGTTARAIRSLEGSSGKVARDNQKKLNSDILKEFGVTGNEINEETIRNGKKMADELFEKATKGESIHLDSEFRKSLVEAIKIEEGKVDSLQHKKFMDILDDFVTKIPRVGQGNLVTVKVPPKLYQEMRSSLGDLSQSAMTEGNYNLSRKYKSIMSEMDNSAERYMKAGDKDLWDDARKKWHIWSILRDASSSGAIKNGDIVPSEFAKLVKAESDTKWALGKSNSKIFDLAKMVDKFPNAFSGNQKNIPAEGVGELITKGIGSAGNIASMATKPVLGSKLGQSVISNRTEKEINPDMIKKVLLNLGIGID